MPGILFVILLLAKLTVTMENAVLKRQITELIGQNQSTEQQGRADMQSLYAQAQAELQFTMTEKQQLLHALRLEHIQAKSANKEVLKLTTECEWLRNKLQAYSQCRK